jgi:phage replication initiation protein
VQILHDGGWDRYGNRPHVQQFGDWLSNDPRDKGLTFNLGTRHASQLLRVYEKAKQLNIDGLTWNRAEVQYSNHARVLPLDMLIDPSSYFLASYPAFVVLFGDLHQACLKTTEKKQRAAKATLDHLVRHGALQVGRLFNALAGLGWSSERIVQEMSAWTDALPKRLEAIAPNTGMGVWSTPAHSHP